MFRKAALSLTALASLTIANAQASSAVVVSSNGYYAAAWGQLLSKEQAIAKATAGPNAIIGVGLWLALPAEADASALANCREKGGTNPRLLASWQERGLDGSLPGTRAGKF